MLGNAPHEVMVNGDTAYVSDQGGRMPIAADKVLSFSRTLDAATKSD